MDKKEEVTLQDTPGTAGQADCVMILSANKQTKKVKVLQGIQRLMTDVDIYDTKRKLLYVSEAPDLRHSMPMEMENRAVVSQWKRRFLSCYMIC